MRQEKFSVASLQQRSMVSSLLALVLSASAMLSAPAQAQTTAPDYKLHPGDKLVVGVYDDPKRSAEDIARFAIEAAAEFDDATGLPVMSHSVKLQRR